MTDSDIVAELRRLYEAAIQHAGDLDETASVLALNIAVVHHLPALLDLAEAELGIPANRKAGIEGEETDEWWAERTRLYELRKSALAALKRSDEG